ncbi:MAG: restriction endonuclease subunit S [Bacteroidales bacterium]|nr:restriction endonuclease subunit S [Bacteroidales bacterium]MCF8389994.1 restriction endonuclease subunit S [Bacteroidales bacterium]
MSEWIEFTIEDFAEICNNRRIPLSSMERNKRKGQFPYYGASGIIDSVDDYIFEGEHVLVSEDGENLRSRKTPIAFLANGKFWVNNHAHILKGKKNFYNKLIVYYLENLDLNPFITGAVQPKLNKASLLSIPFYLPQGENEQKSIASILSSLDDKIDLLHRQNSTLEKMAETLFRQWFENKNNDETIAQLIYIQNGYAFKSKDFRENGTNGVIKIKNISGGIIDIEKTDFIEHKVAESIQDRFSLATGDILIAMTGAEIGKLGIIPKTEKNLWLNQRVGSLKEKFKGAKFLAYLQLKSEFGQDYIDNAATGSAQPNISGTGIENCGFPKLSEELIIEYSNKIGELYEKVISNLGQIRTLVKLRDTLLPKLMSGEVIVT